MYDDDDQITLLVCHKTLKVGCVLLQAAAGCPSGIISYLFDPEVWILMPTQTFFKQTMTYEKWKSFADIANQGQEARNELLEQLSKKS